MKKAGILMFTLILCSCASMERELVSDVVSAGTVTLNRCEVEGFSYDGMKADLGPDKILKVMMIHGVGTHHPGYSRLLQQNLTNNLGFDVQSRLPKNVTLLDPGDHQTPIGNLRVTYWQNKKRTKNMLFYELTWSEITTPYKEIISFDTTEQYSEFRVPFNNMMKKFLDNTLPDPMIYLVDRHDLIINSSQQALCWMLKTDWQDIPNNKAAVCDISIEEQVNHLANENVLFITHSLGSEILMDTIIDIGDEISDKSQKLAASPQFMGQVQKLQNKEINLFMLANQLPILMIDRPLPKVYNQIGAYCSEKGAKYKKRIFKGVNIVAFSDPNDILSYAIPQEFADKRIDSRICPKVTNVSVNVAPEISAFGVGIVNPVTAHTYYDRSPKVINLITHGTADFSGDKILSEQCHFVELKYDRKMKK